jgi:hypothetical protein
VSSHASHESDFAHQLADQIAREFNERLAAFMSTAVQRRKAAEFQHRYEEMRRGRAA